MARIYSNIFDMAVHIEHIGSHDSEDMALATLNHNYVNAWSLAQCCVTLMAGTMQLYVIRRMFSHIR